MNVTLPRRDLNAALSTVKTAASTNSSLASLKSVLLYASGDTLKLTATDLELGAETSTSANVTAPGSVAVPAKQFSEIVSALPEADVTLATQGERLTITCRRSSYQIGSLPAEDFPALPEAVGAVTFTLAQPLLKAMIRQVVSAASDDDTRPILTGISLTLAGGTLTLAATDTHRLAVRKAVLSDSGDGGCIVPQRALNELQKVLADDAGATVTVRIDGNQIAFQTERASIVSRLIEGQFPNYARVIPKEHSRRLVVPREELLSCLKRARIVARDASVTNKVLLLVEGDRLVITADGEQGQCREELECATVGDCDGFSIGFNVTYLWDSLNALDETGVALEFTEPLSPALVRPVDGGDHLCVIMPLQA